MKKTTKTTKPATQVKAENDKVLAQAIAETATASGKKVSNQLEKSAKPAESTFTDKEKDALASAILPPLELSLAAFNESGFEGSFNDWFSTLSLDDIIAIGQRKPAKPEIIKKVKAEIVQDKPNLVPQKSGAELDFARQHIDLATESIKMEIANVANSFCKIGFQLWQVKANKWYESVGLKNISEYGEKYLGFKKSSTANYISICEQFSVHDAENNPTAVLSDKFHLFSYTQLSVMLSLPADKIDAVNPDMTVKDILAAKKESSPAAAPVALSSDDSGSDGCTDIFDRVLNEENIDVLIRLLRDNLGKNVVVTVY